ncbi:hypothetical protein LTS10_002198 [Elasticomyces elasticus]|nr:hypothetical protein LTS10_002198 [Elasticomyces elasticus]
MDKNTVIGFLDLPPEIRNIIYGLALTHEKPLQLIWHPLISKAFKLANYVYQEPHWFERELHKKPIPYINANLLQVNHQVYNEAVPILYGANTIAFSALYGPSDDLLYVFLKKIGSSRKHLRHIKILRVNNFTTLRSALHLLKEAKQLDSFECGWIILHRLTKTPGNVKSFVPWLKTLQKTARANPGRKGALDILLFNPHLQGLTVEDCGGQAESDRKLVVRKDQQRQVMTKLAEALA